MDLLSSGIGGAVGAIAAATLAALKLKTAFNAFSETFHGYFAGRTDPASRLADGKIRTTADPLAQHAAPPARDRSMLGLMLSSGRTRDEIQ